MSRSSGSLAALAAALLACAGATQPGPAAQALAPAAQASRTAPAGTPQKGSQKESMLICEMERPTGSNIAERVCRPATEVEMQRLRTQDMMRTLPNAQKRVSQ